jgi:two-component system chemotaxis sensor kinase CheA
MAQDPYRYFRPEARNLLDQFAQGILELERSGAGAAAVQRLLRLAHTLKGAARVVRQSAIAERAHAIEGALAPFRDGGKIARENIDVILAHLDEIESQVVTLVPGEDIPGAGRPAPAAQPSEVAAEAAKAGAAGSAAQRVIRTDTADADAVLDGVAETQARLNTLRRPVQAMEQLGHLADLLRVQIAKGAAAPASATAQELHRRIATLANELDVAITHADREMRQLRDAAEGLKLVAADTVFVALERTARDLARTLGKQVAFTGTGGDLRLDAELLRMIQSALVQLVRNAVAHGIEAESERLRTGKPPAGRITVALCRRGSRILVECSDDGRGIDLVAVRRAALERGLLSIDEGEPSAQDLLGVLLRGGVSTSAAVTDVAGRGVGLDVVREALERLGGEISVNVDAGRGTRFTLSFPHSVSAVQALIVEAGNGTGALAIPLNGVRRILRLAAGDMARAATGATVLYQQQAVPFTPLAAALGTARRSDERGWTALVVEDASRIGVIGVERLLGTARVVVRQLPDRLKAVPLVAGAALDGDGHPQLVLDPAALVDAAHAAPAAPLDRPQPKRRVLIVDDSLTTRMLEKSILESAGYEVDVASSGEEGLALARRKRFALILCDVEMPGIDGFSFVERIRSDPTLRQVPAILVTSRAAAEDRQRGKEVGAQGYILKSEFDQAALLAMIRSLAG